MENYPKLDPEFKAKWVAALRSSKYEKGFGELYDKENKSYCCLGVAGRISGISTSSLKGHSMLCDDAGGRSFKKETLAKVPKMLTGETILTLGLANMNDANDNSEFNPEGKEFTFPEIADWIEKHL